MKYVKRVYNFVYSGLSIPAAFIHELSHVIAILLVKWCIKTHGLAIVIRVEKEWHVSYAMSVSLSGNLKAMVFIAAAPFLGLITVFVLACVWCWPLLFYIAVYAWVFIPSDGDYHAAVNSMDAIKNGATRFEGVDVTRDSLLRDIGWNKEK